MMDKHIGRLRILFAMVGVVLLNGACGSLYSWSVFVRPLETLLGASRTDISLVFSTAVVFFTAGNFTASFVLGRIPAAALPAFAGVAAALGLGSAAMVHGYWPIVFGYGVMFGFASGFAYNSLLQTASAALDNRPGLANGIVISAFALGSIATTAFLNDSVQHAGPKAAFLLQAVLVGAAAAIASALIAFARITVPARPAMEPGGRTGGVLPIAWVGFFLGSLAGVMSIGHAAAIIQHFGGGPAIVLGGVIALNVGNAIGRFGAGFLADHFPARAVAAGAHAVGTIGFLAVLAYPTPAGAAISMAAAGLAYGMTAAIYPSAVSILLGRRHYGRNFAVLLTSWGVAGLAGPWLGGMLFDMSGDYRIAIEIACLASAAAVFNAARLPRSRLLAAS